MGRATGNLEKGEKIFVPDGILGPVGHRGLKGSAV
jgi:hypothetical protein